MTNGQLLADTKEVDVTSELPNINFLSPNFFNHNITNGSEENKE